MTRTRAGPRAASYPAEPRTRPHGAARCGDQETPTMIEFNTNALRQSPTPSAPKPVPHPADLGPLLTTAQAAKWLACSPRWVQKLTAAGRLRCRKVGQHAVRYSPADLAEFVLGLPGNG